MANNLALNVTADIADLTSKMAVAQVSVKDYGKAMREAAREVAAGDTSDLTKQRLLEVSDSYSKASAQVAIYKREIASAKAPQDQATASAGAMKAGMQSLSYQINDVATMFAMGAPPMQIFASQGGQVIQAIQGMTGSAKGFLGFLGGPWGTVITVAAVALTPFISKLFKTGEAADQAKAKVYDLQAAIADMRTKPMEALGQLNLNVLTAEAKLRQAQAMPRYTGGGSEAYKARTLPEQQRSKAIKDAQAELDIARMQLNVAKQVEKNNQSLFEIRAKAGRSRAGKIGTDDAPESGSKRSGGRSASRGGAGKSTADADAKRAEQERLQAEREALQERVDIIRQEEALVEGRVSTEIELSRIALENQIDDIEAAARAGQISDIEAIQRRAALIGQLDQLDQQHETRIYQARLKQLQDEMAQYAAGTKERRDYLRRIEELEAQHQNRLQILKAQGDQRRRTQDRLLTTESNRRMTGMANTWAGNLARMATLQQGFSATVQGLWQGIAGVAAGVIEQVIQQWIVGEMIKLGLMKVSSTTGVAAEAAKAGAGGVASMAAAPFPMNLTAPAFGASMASAAMAFQGMAAFEQGTNVLPNDMVAQIHAGERIVPKADNDKLIELTKRGALMGGYGAPGAGSGMDRGGGDNYTINAVDARSIDRLLRDRNRGVAKALQRAVRGNFRPQK